MDCCRTRAIIAGTSFGLLLTALKDDADLPDVLPEVIPPAWFDDLNRYRITIMLSTSLRGTGIVASTDQSAALKIECRDSAHYFVNIPAAATANMDAGDIVLTIELRDTLTDAVLKAERRIIPLIKTRDTRL